MKKIINVIKNIFYAVTLCMTVHFCAPVIGQQPEIFSNDEQAALEFVSQMSEDEMLEFAQRIEETVAKMSPEDQKKFQREVEQEATRLQQKIEQYQEETGNTPFGIPVPSSEPEIVESPEPAVEQTVESEEEIVDETDTIQKKSVDKRIFEAENLVSTILDSLNKFINTTQTIPSFDQEIETWGKSGLISNWRPGLTWNFFKGQIQELSHKLHTIKDRNAQTEEYKYMVFLIEDDLLYNQLVHFRDKLERDAPQIEGVSLDMEMLSPEASHAIQGISGTLTEALYQTYLTGKIAQALARYEKIAKKLKDQEISYEEQARKQEAIKLPRQPVKLAGREGEVQAVVIKPRTAIGSLEGGNFVGPPLSQKQRPALKFEEKKKLSRMDLAKTDPIKTKKDERNKEKSEIKEDKTAEAHKNNLESSLDELVYEIESNKFDQLTQTLRTVMNNAVITELITGVENAVKLTKNASKSAGQLRIRVRSLKGKQVNKYRKQLQFIINAYRGKLSRVKNSISEVIKVRNQIEKRYAKNNQSQIMFLFDQLERLKFRIEDLLGSR